MRTELQLHNPLLTSTSVIWFHRRKSSYFSVQGPVSVCWTCLTYQCPKASPSQLGRAWAVFLIPQHISRLKPSLKYRIQSLGKAPVISIWNVPVTRTHFLRASPAFLLATNFGYSQQKSRMFILQAQLASHLWKLPSYSKPVSFFCKTHCFHPSCFFL